MKRTLLTGLAASLIASQATAFDVATMNDAERQAFRAEIRSYLMENPEVLMEALGVLEERQAEAQAQGDVNLIATNAEDLFNDDHSWVSGNPEGDVVMVEFIDYRCGFCRRAHPEVTELVDTDGNIKLITKEFPILGEASVMASQFAIATLQKAGPEAYEQVNQALITMRADITPESLDRLGQELGLDTSQIMPHMLSDEVQTVIADNRALAQRLQINGTPSFVLQDQMLRGYVPLAQMMELVDQKRAAN
ncbi:DsbA family protein [Cognatishimia sp. MH4019]|uniref:DsbA family protein n=1 Tax=Cognatishimia sp. MH4019 TaxID=2854030 RepID=UPI001CD377BD|nr:DsbA family protein [Cognatishimia sp. MH4019]